MNLSKKNLTWLIIYVKTHSKRLSNSMKKQNQIKAFQYITRFKACVGVGFICVGSKIHNRSTAAWVGKW